MIGLVASAAVSAIGSRPVLSAAEESKPSQRHAPSSNLDFISRRSPVIAQHGMVASSQPLATLIGVETLKRGGNAVDAAIAVAAALAVCEPCSTGLGGDCFLLYYDANTQRVHGLNGSGRAAASTCLEAAQAAARAAGDPTKLPKSHGLSVTVPGAAAGWCDAIARWGSGKLHLSEILEPAAALADEGPPVAPIAAHLWSMGEQQLRQSANCNEMMVADPLAPGGCRAPQGGERVPRPGLARTLRDLGSNGKASFYGPQSAVASAIVEEVQAHGGSLTLDDLANHTSTFPDPISATYRGVTLHEVPPNGQGIAALLALNVLSSLEDAGRLGGGGEKSASVLGVGTGQTVSHFHALIEAMRLAFADARWFVTDMDFDSSSGSGKQKEKEDPSPMSTPSPLPQHAQTVAALLSSSYSKQRAALFDPSTALVGVNRGAPEHSSCTVSFQVVDSAGNAVSMVNSNYEGFGTGLVPRGCNFTLQNRGANFSLQAGHPNVIAGGKRPFHTIIPAMATRADGSLHSTLSCMGGFMQPQGHVQLLIGMVAGGLDPQAAIDAPRFCLQDGTSGGLLALEDGVPASVVEALRAKGHAPLQVMKGHDRAVFGRAQIIAKDPVTGALWGGSDGRGDGCAIGY